MILALLAVGTAVVLGMALASTSSASVLTGHSLSVTGAARTAAAGGLDLATAVLADPSRLGTTASPGTPTVLFDQVRIGNTTYRAEVLDLLTEAGATVDSAAVAVIARAESSGVQQALRSAGRLVRPDSFMRADLDLSEFAIFLTGDADVVQVHGGSRIAAWGRSPYAVLREPLVIGNIMGEKAVRTHHEPMLRGWSQYRIGTPASTNEEEDLELSEKVKNIATAVHVPEPPDPERPVYDASTPETLPSDSIATSVICRSDAVFTAPLALGSPGSGIVVDVGGNLLVDSAFEVHGPTVLVVRGNLQLGASSDVVIHPSGSLSVIVYGDTGILSHSIRGSETGPSPSGDGTDAYPPGGTRFILYSRGSSIEARSTIFGEIYAPWAQVTLNGSTMYGRVLAHGVTLEDSNLFYDPVLNSGFGWTNPESAIFGSTVAAGGFRLESGMFSDRANATGRSLELPRTLEIAGLNQDGTIDTLHASHLADLVHARLNVRNALLSGAYAGRVESDPRRVAHRFKLRESVLSN